MKSAAELSSANDSALENAQIEHYRTQDEKIKTELRSDAEERKSREEIISREKPDASWTAEDLEARDLFAKGSYSSKDYLRYRDQRRAEKKVAMELAAKERMASERNKTTVGVKQMGIAAAAMQGDLNRAAQAANLKSRLDATKSWHDNANDVRVRIAELQNSYRQSMVGLAMNENARRRLATSLQAQTKLYTIDRLTALASGVDTAKDKSELLAALDQEKEVIDGILEDLRIGDKVSPQPTQPVQQAAAPAQPDPFLDSLSEVARKDFLAMPLSEQEKVRKAMGGR